MSCPACTGSGESVFVTPRSARRLTAVVAEAELLVRSVSWPPLVTLAVLVIAAVVAGATCATRVKIVVPAAPVARLDFVQLTVPFDPTGGVVQVQPAAPAPEI